MEIHNQTLFKVKFQMFQKILDKYSILQRVKSVYLSFEFDSITVNFTTSHRFLNIHCSHTI